jgi:hypothetical protein
MTKGRRYPTGCRGAALEPKSRWGAPRSPGDSTVAGADSGVGQKDA